MIDNERLLIYIAIKIWINKIKRSSNNYVYIVDEVDGDQMNFCVTDADMTDVYEVQQFYDFFLFIVIDPLATDFFCRFLRDNVKYALIAYWLIDATITGNFFDDPFLFKNINVG